MMKRILLAAVCLFSAYTAQAQLKVNPGIKAGMNLSNLVLGGQGVSLGLKPDMYAGAFVRLGGEKIGFQPELVYSRQGARFKPTSTLLLYTIEYINVPLMFRIGSEKITFDAGPQLGFAFGARTYMKADTREEEIYSKDGLSLFDLAVCAGTSVRLYGGLEFNARFNMGLLSAVNRHIHVVNDYIVGGVMGKGTAPKRHNMTLQFGLSYTFGY